MDDLDLILPGDNDLASNPAESITKSDTISATSDEELSGYSLNERLMSPQKTVVEDVDRDRYEQLRRSAFSKNALKKAIAALTGAGVGPVMLFVIGGFTKKYVGELTQEALQVQKETECSGAITPEQLAEAYRRYHGRNYRSTVCTFFPRNSANKRLLCKRL